MIRIDSRAGIRNPRKSGTYNLGVYTSADTVSASISVKWDYQLPLRWYCKSQWC